MKYAILSDIHANLEALQSALADAAKQNCTHYVCLGDIVGYGPNPRECLDIVRGLNCPVVMGNHDEYSANSSELIGFNPMAAEGIKWTRNQLTEEERTWLRGLKYTRVIDPFTIVLALGVAAGTGIFFGFYPAWRASRLNPIDALRYE